MNTALILRTAEEAARKAGAVLMKYYGKLKTTEIAQKSKNDFVTKVDKMSEKLIIALVKKRFPGHSFLGEESGLTQGRRLPAGRQGTCWIIDPLDGTSNYIHNFPMFAVSIGVAHEGKLVAGVVYDALHDEMFTARLGRGAFLNGRRIHVTRTPKLTTAMMATGIPFRARKRFKQYFKSLQIISLASAGMRRGGSAALDLAYVACGRFDAFWEINLSPWDIAAGALLITEAGGRITDVHGKPAHMQNGDVLASNKRIHVELQKITKGVFK